MPQTVGRLPSGLYRRFRPAFTNILSSYVCLHFRIIRLHLVFYFANLSRPPEKMGHIQQLWIRTNYVLKKAISNGHLLEHPEDRKWLFLPGTDASALQNAFKRNSQTYRIWMERSHNIGHHCNLTIRGILTSKGFRQPKNPPTLYLDLEQQVKEITPDAFTLAPINTAFEVKNGLSDIWPDPRTIDPAWRSDDIQQILNHFQMCKQHHLFPGFIGVKFDPAFYDFAKDNDGLVFELGFQIFPPHLQTLKNVIATDLGFRNIVVVSKDPPYPPKFAPFFEWLDNIKQLRKTP